MHRWRRPAWLDEGDEPDYRFSLANERTFLAWIRTALGLLAAAVAVVQLVPRFWVSGVRTALGTVLAVLGALLSGLAYYRWASVERAMRRKRPLPYNRLLPVLAVALTVVGVVIVLVALLGGT